jgi:hypothetical protein
MFTQLINFRDERKTIEHVVMKKDAMSGFNTSVIIVNSCLIKIINEQKMNTHTHTHV